MANALHNEIIASLKQAHPEIQTRGFWKAMRRLDDAEYTQDLLANDPNWLSQCKFVPDAWTIDVAERHVFLFEAVDTSDISPSKFSKIHELSWVLAEDDYTLALTRCDRFGRRAFHVQMTGLASEAAGEPTEGYLVHNWPRFSTEYCLSLLSTPRQGRA